MFWYMPNQPYVGRIALSTRKKLLKSGEIRHFYGTVYNVHSTHCLYVHYTLSVHTCLKSQWHYNVIVILNMYALKVYNVHIYFFIKKV